MLIKDVMSKPPITIELSSSAYAAYKLMESKKIRRLPVVKGEQLVGIITDRDIRDAKPSKLADLPAKAAKEILLSTSVEEIMTKAPITVIGDDPIEQAALLMTEQKIGGLPVVEKDKVIGVITETDIFRLFSTLFGAEVGSFQVVLLNTEETRIAVINAFQKFSTRIRSIFFSPKYPEIVMVFRAPGGKEDTEAILDELHKCSFQILDWHLFESKKVPV